MHSTSGLRRRTKSLRVSLQYLMSTKSPHGGTRRADSSRTSYGHLLHTVLSCATESITPAAQLEHAVRAPGAPPRICCPYIALHAHTECDPRALFLTCARATRKPHLCRQACDTVRRLRWRDHNPQRCEFRQSCVCCCNASAPRRAGSPSPGRRAGSPSPGCLETHET